jgi:chemotaxis protein MotB
VPSKAPIIVIRRKRIHGGTHGGAWKVAYADFVTAMMALSIVLWLTSASKPIRDAVAGYFKDPLGTSTKVGSGMAGVGDNFIVNKENMDLLKQ